MKTSTLHDVLMGAVDLDWREALYLPKDETLWCASCEAITADPDAVDVYDSSGNPVAIDSLGYAYVLLCDNVASIMANLEEERGEPGLDAAFRAFRSYLANDAFITG